MVRGIRTVIACEYRDRDWKGPKITFWGDEGVP